MSRAPASDRLRRLLALLPWMMSQPGGASVDDVCARFGVTRAELLAELERLRMVGVYPYSPEKYIDWTIEGDRITIFLADWFKRPLRLTPDQALALIATARSMTSVEGADPDGPLARGVAKVAAVLGVDPATVDVDLGAGEAGVLTDLQGAIASRHQVGLDYYSYGRDERTQRTVDPYRLHTDQGQWYLTAFCHTSGAERLFRVDRIQRVDPLESTFEPAAETSVHGLFAADGSLPRVTIDLAPNAAWVLEQYPYDTVEHLEDGRLRVTLAISAVAWLERLLLRLGPDATVVSAPDELHDVARSAANRLLQRYRR